ncbi:hypothetical protein K440DRAFT_512979, partial [Wilcoxina mikolae CBS 423.85]
MWTADWWWKTQANFPLSEIFFQSEFILGSDKTMISTLSGDKSAWPVYFNVQTARKPTLLRLHIKNLWQQFHPLEEPAKSGIKVRCADGRTHLAYPQIASFVADYPEQCNITGVKYGWYPRCEIAPD